MQVRIAAGYMGRNFKFEAGKWYEVATSTLFADQYLLEVGGRVYDEHIDAVRNDARKGMTKCGWCGRIFPAGEKCHDGAVYSLESIFTQYDGNDVPFSLPKGLADGNEIRVTKNGFYTLSLVDGASHIMYLHTPNCVGQAIRIAFVAGVAYRLGNGYRKVRPYKDWGIAGYAGKELIKMAREAYNV